MVTVLIPTQANELTKPYCEACVASIMETAPWYSVVVITNGPDVLPLNVDVEILHTDKPGQCQAVNLALESVDTKYVMVSNDDMIFGPGWDNSLLRSVQEYRCVSSTLVEPNPGAPPFYNYDCGDSIQVFEKGKWLQYVAQMTIGGEEQDLEDGFNLPFITETEIFKTIGGYDEEYDPGGCNSDPDVMHKMMIAGIRPMRDRLSLVYHFSLQSGGMDKDKKSWWNNWRYFPRKWGFERDGRNNIWYAGGKEGTRIPTEDKPYVFEGAHGAGKHPGKDWLEFTPPWLGKFGDPVYGEGQYYDQ